MRLYLVRHAAVTVRPELPGSQWHLSSEGRAAAGALAGEPYWAELCALHTSPEPKAVATAQRLAARHGRPIRIEPDLREVENRAWVGEGYRELVGRYLAGDPTAGWEPREAALGRVRACFDGIAAQYGDVELGIVSHGLVLTVYLADLLGLDGNGCYGLWSRLRMPDVAVIDPNARRLERGFGHADAEK